MDANYGSSSSNDYNASLIGRGGGSSSRRRAPPFPPLEEAGDAAFVQSSFDPVNLLEVGLREWRDRTLSLQCLKKSRSVAALHSFLDTSTSSGAASFRIPDYRAATKRWQELAAAAAAISSTSDAYGDPPMEEMNSSGVAPDVPLPEDYYSSLAVAPHASLIHIVILYHQALCSHGLFDEAYKIAGLLEGLQGAEQAEAVADLQGMDLLLKDGLLELYLRIQPYLPPVPSQIVKFKSVTYTRDVFVTDDAYETVLTKAFECVRGPVVGRKRSQKVKVLKDVTGYLMPGTLTLVLGPPACGKSSLHHVLSGSLYAGASLEGAITYNDERIRDISIHRLAAMVGHLDIHLPLLTVRETLEFARECLLAFRPKHYGPELLEIMGGVLKIGQDPKLEINMSMMGLKHAADRLVGSLLTPSITEDERHRLTAAEMFSGAHAVYFFDQLHTVAEDSITYDLLTSIRIFTRVRQITFMASLLQPSSEVFDLFDRLILLNQGHVVYQGPRQDALPYFESLGYRKPKHLGVGEFLQEVTTGDGVAYLQPGFRKLEVEDFVSSYKSSNMHRDICRVVDSSELVQELWVQGAHPLGVNFAENKHSKENELESSFYVVSGTADKDGSLVHMSMDHTTSVQPGDKLVAFGGTVGETLYIDTLDSSKLLNGNLLGTLAKVSEPVRLQLERTFTKISSVQFSEDYVLGFKSEALLLMIRELKVTWRNKFGLHLRLLQVLVLSFFVGFLLFRVKSDADQKNMNLFRTAFFVSILNMTMFNVGQLPALMDERHIYYKQKGAHFFRPISYLLGKIAGSLPFSLCEGTIWTLIVYFLTGMSVANGGWHFFVYFVIIILTVLNGASMVRFFSFSAPDKEKAGMFIGLVVTLFILFAGFLLPRFKVPKYWLWMYYIDPLQWAITALVINEYNSASYSKLCKDVHDLGKIPQCAGRPNDTVGHAFLARGQFYTSNHWIAVSIAVLCAWLLLWNILTYLAMSKLQHGRILKAGKPVNAENKINAEEMQVEDVESAIRKLSHTAIPVTLSWHELSYDLMVPSIKKPRTILSYVSGWGEPYDMVALIGSEAAGKTTLLNCLAGRKVLRERIGGQILVNSYPKVQKDFGHIMGYVDKIDAYTPYMTVRETLAYSAALRLGKLSSKQKQVEFVEEVLELTELKHLEGALVVALINDITFDQEKRLAIATELVANPSVLFLDDPTKGLDSSSAARITRCLQQIAKTGRLVIVTLKYPSQRILSMFTKVQILKTGGETVYFGPVGKNSEMIRTYFEAIPGTPLCPPNKSISTYAVDVIGDRVTYRKSVKDYAFEYRVSELALRNHVHLQHLRRSKGQNGPEIQAQDYGANFASMLHQTIMTIQRQYWRNVNYSWGRMISYLITSLILGSVFFKIDIHTTAGMNSGAGAIFISCVLVGLTNAQNAIPQVMQMRAVYQRERAVHQANVFLYNIAYTLAEIPYLMVANLIFCSIYLPMTNIAVQSAAQFLKYWFISLEFYMVITFLGMLLAVISPLPQIASVLVPIVVGIWVSTAGLVVPKSKILHQFIWIFWTNPLQYALDGLTSVSFFCDLEKAVCLNAGLNPACESQPSACPLCDCPRLVDTSSNTFVWRQIASNRSLHYSRVPYDMLALFLSAVLIRFLTLVALRYMKHNKTT